MLEYHQQSSLEIMKRLDVTNQGLNDYDVQNRKKYTVLINWWKEKEQVHSPFSLDSLRIY